MKGKMRTEAMPGFPARSPEREAEIQRLHEMLPSLGDEEIVAVYFRFWESLLIEEIANILGRSWNYTDQLIERSLRKLRQGFTELPAKRQAVAA